MPSTPEAGLDVVGALHHWAERTPEALALQCGSRASTYRELWRAVSDVRRRVGQSRQSRGAPIAVEGEPREETVAEILGVIAAGRAVVLIPPSLGLPERGAFLGAARATAIAELDADDPGGDAPLAPDADGPIFWWRDPSGERFVEVRRSDLALALGWAKGALDLGPGDRVALALPLLHHLAALDLVAALAFGATLVLPVRPLTAREAVGWLADERISVLHLLPSTSQPWAARAEGRRLPALRRVWFSGEPLPDPVALLWRDVAPGAELWNVYDSIFAPFAFAHGRVRRPTRSGMHPLGEGAPGVALVVSGPDGEPAPAETIGDLVVVHPRLGRCATGDRARRLADGRVEPVVEGGDPELERQEVGELEAALAGLPGVEGAAVVRPMGGAGEAVALTAFVVGRVEKAAWREALRGLMREDAEAMPIIAIDALPLLADGRVDRARLRRSGSLAGAARRDLAAPTSQFAGPRTPTEATVAALWQRLLGVTVGVDEDFFLAGGQSLLAAQLAARLSALLNIDMPLSIFFERTTIAGQAAWLDRAPADAAVIERSPRRQGSPLSYAQERHWFFEQMSPGTTVQHLQWMFSVEGGLDGQILEGAMQRIADRHEALRTVFRRDAQGPTQHVVTTLRRWHELHDLCPLGPAAHAAAVRHAETAFQQPFDLERGPLWRTLLFKTGPREHLLAIQMHHIISDAWSLTQWMLELSELYAAALGRRDPALPVLAVQPADLVTPERQAVTSGALDAQIDFWRRSLSGLPSGIDLPTDHPRPKQPSYRGVFVPLAISAKVAGELRAVARQRGATLFMALTAALSVLLARLSGQTDLVVGTPVGGRDRVDTRDLIGLFLNNVPIRVDASGDPSFGGLLDRCRDAARAAFSNAALPFERLLTEVSVPRGAGRHPIFDVMLNLVPDRGLELAGLSVTTMPGNNGSAPLDVLVSFRELPDGSLAGDLRCAADLFTEATAERMARCLQTVIAAVARAPDRALGRVPLLDDEERRAVTVTWNATDLELPAAAVPALIEAMVDERPDAVAVVSGEQRQTFRELDRRANRIAQALTRRGLPREAPVAVLLRRCLDLPAAVLGALKAGGAFVLLDPELPPARVRAMLAAAAPFAVISHRGLAAEIAPDLGERALCLDEPAALAGAPQDRLDLTLGGAALAYLMFTSGSTGTPKGVMVPHGGLANRLAWVRSLFPFAAGEVVCQKTPLGFIDAIWEILGPLRDGVPCVLPPADIEHDPATLSETLERAGVTRIMLVPSLLRALLALHRGREGWLPRLTLWMVGGEELRPDLARDFLSARPDARLVNLYGSAEVSGEATYHPVTGAEITRIPIGVPGPNVRAYVLDPAGEPVPPGIWGELCVGGAGVARGYLADPEQTAARFGDDPFHAGGRLFHTRDRARRLDGGVIEYAGRLDQQLKIQGVRIDPAEVEDALRGSDEILDAAVVPAPAADGGHRLVAYFVARDAARRPRPSELRAHLRRLLPEPMVPTIFMPLDALPLSQNGKVDRAALPEPVEVGAEDVRPKTTTELALAGLWDELLESGPYGVEDDFFAKGGYSLLLAELALRIRSTFTVDVPLGALFKTPALASQAQCVDEARRRGASRLAIEPVVRQPRLPLSFAQERLWLSESLKFDAMPHVVPLALRLRGELDAERLERAMDAVAARHESLRTTFSSELGVPFQTVQATLIRLHERVDLSAESPQGREAEVARRQAAEHRTPFDLVRGPPWRSSILRLGAEEHVLLVTMSHLVSDAASVQCWLDEVATFYAAPSISSAEVPELELQPVDLAVWGRRAVSLGLLDEDRSYWREALAGAAPPVDLPADGPRGPADSGGWIGAHVPSATLLRLREVALLESTTLFAVLLTSLGMLLAEITHEPIVTVGVLSAGREQREAQPLIGLFLNAVPVRFVARGAFREALGRGHAALMGALAHSAVPFERVVADVNAVRQPRRNPIFDVVLNDVPTFSDFRLGGARTEPLAPPATIPSPFDLMWRVLHRPDGLHVRLEYRRGLFAEPRAQAWLDRYLAMLERAAEAKAPP